jgi:membrane dipeptidase
MYRRSWLWVAVLSMTPAFLAAQDELARARRINQQAIGIDAHIDTLQRVLIEKADIGQRLTKGHVDIPRLKEGGMHAPFFALYVPTYYKGAEAVRRTLDLRDAMQRVLDAYPQEIELATTASDIERIVAAGKIAAFLTVEGGHQIDNDLGVLRIYYQLGIRAMTLTHFRNNDWADSSTDSPRHNGLTDFGRQVVGEMNRLGMIVDVSHVSDKTFYDTLGASTKPVIASHSACRVLSDIPRNMTDDMLRALSKNGGVVGINFGSGFLNRKSAGALKKSISSMAAAEPDLVGKDLDKYAQDQHAKDIQGGPAEPSASIDDVVANIDHVVKVAGIDHVGIGTDYDGVSSVPVGLEDVSRMPNLTAALLKHGYSESDIRKILGGNFLRVIREVTGR